jgi:polar amino acid transport system substrate-binding protein
MVRFIKQAERLIKKFKIGLIIGLTCLLCIFSVSNTIAQPTLSSSEVTPIRIGVRDAAYPIAHDIKPDRVKGFCGTFGDALSRQLKRDVVYVDVSNQYLDPEKYPRYYDLTNKITDIECGPNSRSTETKGVEFSDTIFYSTGIKLLVKKNLSEEVRSNPTKYKIGAIKKTSTCKVIDENMHLLNKCYDDIDQALDALDTGTEIKMFASDEIILKSWMEKGLTLKKDKDNKTLRKARDFESGYILLPSETGKYITGDEKTEKYVMAFAANNPLGNNVLKAEIDIVLKSLLVDEGKKLDNFLNPPPPYVGNPGTSVSQTPTPSNTGHQRQGFKIGEHLFQVLLVFIGLFIQILGLILEKEHQRRLAMGLGLIVIVVGLVWIGVLWGSS